MSRISFVSLSPYLMILAGFLVLQFGFDFNGLFGQDAHEYFRYTKALKLQLSDGIPAGDFHWPKGYPLLGALGSFSGVSVLLSLQLISLVACMGTVLFAQKSIRLLYQSSGALFLLLGAATQVYFLRMGYLVMSDALCAFLVMLAVYTYLQFRKTASLKFLVIFLFASVFAVFTRYASVPIVAILLLNILWIYSKKRELWARFSILVLLIGSAVGVLYFNNHALGQIVDRIQEWHPLNLLHRTHGREGRFETNMVPNVVYIWSNFLHLGFLSIGVLLLLWIRKWNFKERGLWVAILVYLAFIGGLELQNQRFMVLTHVPILVLLYPAFEALWFWLKAKKLTLIFAAGVLLFNGGLFYFSFEKTYRVHKMEKEIVAALQPFDDSTPILSFYVDQSFASYDLPNPTQSLWESYPDFIPGGLVVFNPTKFETSWRNGSVMQNWELLQKEHTLVVVKELPENWKIYRIE